MPFLEKWSITAERPLRNVFLSSPLLVCLFFADFTWQKLLGLKSVIYNHKTSGSRGREKAREGRQRGSVMEEVVFLSGRMIKLGQIIGGGVGWGGTWTWI